MKRAAILLVILPLIFPACGSSISIWGAAQTPTPPDHNPLLSLADPTSNPDFTDVTPAPTDSRFYMVEEPPTQTSTPATASLLIPTHVSASDSAPVLYYSQSGDSLRSLGGRFDAEPEEITSNIPLSTTGLIDPGTLLIIPYRINEVTTPNVQIMPDNEIIFSATAVGFDLESYVSQAGGRLSKFREYLGSTGWIDGDRAIARLASENSINPRILLGILEYESRWVRGEPVDILHSEYPMGFEDFRYKGLYMQMVWAVNQLSIGYYGWRSGTITQLTFTDGTSLRLDPRLNAGTVAIQYLFSRLHSQSQWSQIINPSTGFPAMYTEMFGDPWARADIVNPIFPPGLSQPPMVLPFEPNRNWHLVQGPHGAWQHIGALAAIDLAPSTERGGCEATPRWVLAAAPGLVIRSDTGVVIVDMDGDGYEQTGWVLLYLHVGTKDRVKVGTWLEVNDRIGHPSCEGGESYGTHVHFARKYNGEWLIANGAIPMVLSGWTVDGEDIPHAGFMTGTMTKGDQTVIADEVGQLWSLIIREPDE